ncbi:MAG: aldolase/citrate lyase family protein [Collinsella phocaeensis]|uniref:aldolase/citrate lyase family protein n=1 Tax=Collinsella phocaeensis TaxID=1871016 RepID=UPI000930BD4F|nr:aldolase/citrate lyase family protein [Collinsella phocaeensis]
MTQHVTRPKPEKNRLRRTMMFMNAQKPGLIKDAYIYGADTIMLDLEDAVAESQKDAARFSLYHALTTIDYGDTEVLVRINGLDTPHWQEDIRVAVAGGADGIRIAKCESAQDVKTVEEHILMAEREFGIEEGRTLIMAALESARGVVNAYEICTASDRLFGVALAGGDFRKDMRVKVTESGIDIMVARGMMLLAARAAGVQCFDTNFADFKNMEGFENEVRQNHQMGFDGKSIINPRQIRLVHQVFTPSAKEVDHAERLVRAYNEQASAGVGVFTFEGKMVDIAHVRDAQDLLKLAKASGVYHGDL